MAKLLDVSLIKRYWNYLIKTLLQKQSSKNNVLTIHEYRNLGSLLQSGVSLSVALDIIKTSKNEKIIKYIQELLLNGENIETILFTEKDYSKLFKTFNYLYSLDKAILIVVDIIEKAEKERKALINKLIYPFIIVIVSMSVMYFGCFKLIPNMINMFESMGIMNDNILLYLSQGIVVFMCLLLLMILSMIILGYIVFKRNLLINIYNSINITYVRKIISNIITYLFISHYIVFLEKSLTTREIQEVMLLGDESHINYQIALLLQKRYEEGMSFVDAFSSIEYFDERSKQLIKIGYITNSLIAYINIYIEEIKAIIQKSIKYIILCFQGFSYVSVCICVLTIANLLFEPLSILENM
ncbi:MAG: hypothetical protein IKM20_07420 [Erysipelotrichales bacterium]|nr:hypothetical protein [Erysipelotrichales bacterium]